VVRILFYILSAFWNLDLACIGVYVCIQSGTCKKKLGHGECRLSFLVSIRVGGQGSWLLNLSPTLGVSFDGVLWSIADFLGPSIWLLESAAL
jgi:hypothetical protein